MGPPSSDRYVQPATPARSDIGRSSMTRPFHPGFPGYGYPEQQYSSPHMQGSSPMQGVEMQYQASYMHDPSRQQHVQASPSQQPQQPQQHYAQYAPGSMLPPGGAQALYDNIPFQQHRQDAIEVMASQFAVPQYMPQGEHAGAGGVGPSPTPFLTSQAEPSTYGSVAVTRAPLAQSFGSSQGDFSTMEQQVTESSTAQEANPEATDEGMRDFRRQLRATFTAIVAGRVNEASEKLMAVSSWLVNSVATLGELSSDSTRLEALNCLGLHHDDETSHEQRLELWREFNLCWEALGQKQKDVTEEALRSNRQPADMLSGDTMSSLVEALIKMGDQLEQDGLVDFEMGIWEEQIIHIFTVCLDLLRSDPPARRQSETS